MYATFVLPAPNGCNLNCPYCAVALRNEAREINLSFVQYHRFLNGALHFTRLKKVSIVGYEPTLDEVVDLTISLLDKAKGASLETSMNTNGINFPKHAQRLARVVDTVMISLDSSIPTINDRMRGKQGTFVGTSFGIKSAVATMGSDRVIVNTLLVPNKPERIELMPEVLSNFGVKTWVISPYIDFREGELQPDIDFIKGVVQDMAAKAQRFGITVMYADEFRLIGKIDGIPTYNFQRPGEPDEFVFRLSPNGSCSVGNEILMDSSVAFVWDGKEDPAAFLYTLKSHAQA